MNHYKCSHLCEEVTDLFTKFRSGLAVQMINYHRGRPSNSKEVDEVLDDITGISASLQKIKEILKELR
tara:strand:+ start:4860 stop:5063 length:204 start_codon:yes stop_codon:yes gene_type:complete